jgi:hypothetical protein
VPFDSRYSPCTRHTGINGIAVGWNYMEMLVKNVVDLPPESMVNWQFDYLKNPR